MASRLGYSSAQARARTCANHSLAGVSWKCPATFIGARKRERNALPGTSGFCHPPLTCGWLRPEFKIRVRNGPERSGDKEISVVAPQLSLLAADGERTLLGDSSDRRRRSS